MSPFRIRKSVRLLPGVRLNLGSRRGPSLSFRVGPFSYSPRRGTARVNLPGPVSYETPRPKR